LAVATGLAGASAAAYVVATERVRADRVEREETLPGDDVIPSPIGSLTNAITIHRPPGEVWPWLVQMGAGRAGWYSYDIIDNGGRRSAFRIVPELQHLTVGMVFPALPGATDGFVLLSYEPERFLVLGWRSPNGAPLVTWAFVLRAMEKGATRLIVRARGGPGYQFHAMPWGLAKHIVPFGHFVMQRKQLLGIALRAERVWPRIAARR
jgi:uncharacterized protein YndB with AHSA1/START domain